MRNWLAKTKSALLDGSIPAEAVQERTAEPDQAAEQDGAAGQSPAVDESADLSLEALRSQSVSLRELMRRQQALEDRLTATEMKARQAEQRVEIVRREIMFELAAGKPAAARSGDGADRPSHEHPRPRIIDPAKLDRSVGALRLNLGCGHIPLPGYVNVDFRDLPGVDVVAAAGDLPFEPTSVGEIFSSHMLEHFPLEELRRVLLPYWISLLRPGGLFRAIVPDADAMMRAYVAGEMSFADITEVTFGSQDYVGNQHYTMFSQDSIRPLLQQAGLTSFKLIAAGRRNGLCLEMEFSAIKPMTVS